MSGLSSGFPMKKAFSWQPGTRDMIEAVDCCSDASEGTSLFLSLFPQNHLTTTGIGHADIIRQSASPLYIDMVDYMITLRDHLTETVRRSVCQRCS